MQAFRELGVREPEREESQHLLLTDRQDADTLGSDAAGDPEGTQEGRNAIGVDDGTEPLERRERPLRLLDGVERAPDGQRRG